MISVAVQSGLGRHTDRLTEDEVSSTKRALIANFALTILTEGFAAASFLVLLRNMKPDRQYQRLMTVLSAVVAAWSLAGTFRFASASSSAVTPLGVR